MSDSPMSASPYEVLGVRPNASMEELRVAYRQRLRSTHPDTGGDSAAFIAVQSAWERIGTPEARARFDLAHSEAGPAREWGPRPRTQTRDTRPRARSYGHPGGWRRERYLQLIREWSGRGVDLTDPYQPGLVRSAPREIRHLLADAIAEEQTAGTLAHLGIGFTVWHDVAAPTAEEKIDHVALGPTGLFAILSEDFGSAVEVRRGEIAGTGVAGERPLHALATRAKTVGRSARVRFSALVVVLPDGSLTESPVDAGRLRGIPAVVTAQSDLGALMRGGLAGARTVGGTELFDVRSRLQDAIRFA